MRTTSPPQPLPRIKANESNNLAVTGHHHPLLGSVVSVHLCQIKPGQALTFQSSGQLYYQLQILHRACSPPHRCALPGTMTEARAALESAGSDVTREDLKRKVPCRPKEAVKIINPSSYGRLIPFIFLFILLHLWTGPKVREPLRIKPIFFSITQEIKMLTQNQSQEKHLGESQSSYSAIIIPQTSFFPGNAECKSPRSLYSSVAVVVGGPNTPE